MIVRPRRIAPVLLAALLVCAATVPAGASARTSSHHHAKKRARHLQVQSGATTLTVGPTFLAALQTSQVALTPVEPATVAADSATLVLPVSSGALILGGHLAGVLHHAGGLLFASPEIGGVFDALDLRFSGPNQGSLTGTLGGDTIELAQLMGVRTRTSGRTTLITATALLAPDAVETLNAGFSTTFTWLQAMGTVSIRAVS